MVTLILRRRTVSSVHAPAPAAGVRAGAGAGAGVLILAAVAVLAQALDMAAGARVAALHAAVTVNPLSWVSFAVGGSAGSAAFKMAVTIAAAVLFVELARNGRERLAHTFLILSAAMGLMGFVAKIL